MFLGESNYPFIGTGRLNGMLMSMNDTFSFVGLIMDGYIFAYARHGSMVLPSELAILLSHFDYKIRTVYCQSLAHYSNDRHVQSLRRI